MSMGEVKRTKSCCFSGHRSTHFDMDFSYTGHILQEHLSKAIKDACSQGFDTFYSGMAQGFDIIAAEAVLREKYSNESKNITLICVIPFKGQDVKWSRKWRDRHDEILKICDNIVTLNDEYVTGCYHQRNRYLIDHARRLIGFYSGKKGGTKHAFEYALERNLEIVNIWSKMEL